MNANVIFIAAIVAFVVTGTIRRHLRERARRAWVRNQEINSFYDTCVKMSARTYRSLLRKSHTDYRVGSINCEVYHVNETTVEAYGR